MDCSTPAFSVRLPTFRRECWFLYATPTRWCVRLWSVRSNRVKMRLTRVDRSVWSVDACAEAFVAGVCACEREETGLHFFTIRSGATNIADAIFLPAANATITIVNGVIYVSNSAQFSAGLVENQSFSLAFRDRFLSELYQLRAKVSCEFPESPQLPVGDWGRKIIYGTQVSRSEKHFFLHPLVLPFSENNSSQMSVSNAAGHNFQCHLSVH